MGTQTLQDTNGSEQGYATFIAGAEVVHFMGARNNSALVHQAFLAVFNDDGIEAKNLEAMYSKGLELRRDVAYQEQLAAVVAPVKNDGRINEQSLGILNA